MLVLFIILSFTSCIYLLFEYKKHLNTKKLLTQANTINNATPIKELATDFKNFIEGVDGKLSLEAIIALKRLENFSQEMDTYSKKTIDTENYNLFVKEMNFSKNDYARLRIVKRWLKKFRFSQKDQTTIICNLMKQDYYSDNLYRIFEKENDKWIKKAL